MSQVNISPQTKTFDKKRSTQPDKQPEEVSKKLRLDSRPQRDTSMSQEEVLDSYHGGRLFWV